ASQAPTTPPRLAGRRRPSARRDPTPPNPKQPASSPTVRLRHEGAPHAPSPGQRPPPAPPRRRAAPSTHPHRQRPRQRPHSRPTPPPPPTDHPPTLPSKQPCSLLGARRRSHPPGCACLPCTSSGLS